MLLRPLLLLFCLSIVSAQKGGQRGAASDSSPAVRALNLGRKTVAASEAIRQEQEQEQEQDREPAGAEDSDAVDAGRTNGHPAPEPYAFSYLVDDPETGASTSREERQDANGEVRGFYYIKDHEGRTRRVDYTAGRDGFRATIKTNEEGVVARSPADVNIEVSPSQGFVRYASKDNSGRQQQQQQLTSESAAHSLKGAPQTPVRRSKFFERLNPTTPSTTTVRESDSQGFDPKDNAAIVQQEQKQDEETEAPALTRPVLEQAKGKPVAASSAPVQETKGLQRPSVTKPDFKRPQLVQQPKIRFNPTKTNRDQNAAHLQPVVVQQQKEEDPSKLVQVQEVPQTIVQQPERLGQRQTIFAQTTKPVQEQTVQLIQPAELHVDPQQQEEVPISQVSYQSPGFQGTSHITIIPTQNFDIPTRNYRPGHPSQSIEQQKVSEETQQLQEHQQLQESKDDDQHQQQQLVQETEPQQEHSQDVQLQEPQQAKGYTQQELLTTEFPAPVKRPPPPRPLEPQEQALKRPPARPFERPHQVAEQAAKRPLESHPQQKHQDQQAKRPFRRLPVISFIPVHQPQLVQQAPRPPQPLQTYEQQQQLVDNLNEKPCDCGQQRPESSSVKGLQTQAKGYQHPIAAVRKQQFQSGEVKHGFGRPFPGFRSQRFRARRAELPLESANRQNYEDDGTLTLSESDFGNFQKLGFGARSSDIVSTDFS